MILCIGYWWCTINLLYAQQPVLPGGTQSTIPSKLVAVLPFQYLNNRIMLTLKLNGSVPLRFMFDTGADGIGIKKSIADSIGIYASEETAVTAVGGQSNVGIARNIEMQFDTLKIPDNSAAILPRLDESLDGLFGGNFLRNYITEINFDKSEIRLYTIGRFNYPAGASLIPLDYTEEIPDIPVRVILNNGKLLNGAFHFDTGAGYPMIIFGPTVSRNNLTEDFKVAFRSRNTSLGYQSFLLNGEFNRADIGDRHIDAFRGNLQVYREGDEAWAPRSDGSLGIELINRFNWIINVADHRFAAVPNRNFNMPAAFWLRNIEWQFVNGNIVVKRFMPDTATALCGIAANNKVVSINGIAAEELMSEGNINRYTEIWKDESLEVVVEKDGKTEVIKVP